MDVSEFESTRWLVYSIHQKREISTVTRTHESLIWTADTWHQTCPDWLSKTPSYPNPNTVELPRQVSRVSVALFLTNSSTSNDQTSQIMTKNVFRLYSSRGGSRGYYYMTRVIDDEGNWLTITIGTHNTGDWSCMSLRATVWRSQDMIYSAKALGHPSLQVEASMNGAMSMLKCIRVATSICGINPESRFVMVMLLEALFRKPRRFIFLILVLIERFWRRRWMRLFKGNVVRSKAMS